MATYRITTPDGATYNVTAPDSATPDQVMAYAQQMHQRVADQINNDAISQGARNFNSDASTLDNLRAGIGKAFADVARGVGQLIPTGPDSTLVSRDDVAQARKRDAQLMSTKAGLAGNVVGNLAITAPAAFIPGAATIPGGAAVGAATGLLHPSTSTRETLTNTGIGTAAGAVVPLVSRLVQIGKAAAEPLYEGGQNAIVGRTLNKAAGKDAPAVAQRLSDASQPFVGPSQGAPRTVMGEYVPGSLPTVGQAAENAGVAALERAATANNPAVTNAVSDTMKAQNAARTGVLTDMAGTDGAREFFGEARDATAKGLYAKPNGQVIPADPELKALLQRMPGGHHNGVIQDAMELARIKGEPLKIGKDIPATTVASSDASGAPILEEVAGQPAEYSGKALHYIKLALDNALSKTGDSSLGTTTKQAITGLKKDYLSYLDANLPGYGTARREFAAISRPINQMDVAQAIADKSVNKLTGNLQPNAYARALSDKTAQQVTGLNGSTLEGVMDPAQMNALNSILLDVQRSNAAQNVGRGVGSDTVQKLAYTNLMDQSGVPTFLREFKPLQVVGGLAGRGADAVYGRANREISNRLAEVMLDPAMAADLMKRTTPAQRNQLLEMVKRSASGVALSAPAPVSAYALEQ